MHKLNLAASSSVFEGIVAGKADREEIDVTESGGVLALLLPFCYPDKVALLDPGSSKFWALASAFDKYQVSGLSRPRCGGRD